MITLIISTLLVSCFNKKSGNLEYVDPDTKTKTSVSFENSDESNWISEKSLQTILNNACESSKIYCKNPLTFKPISMTVKETYMNSGSTNEVILVFQCSNSFGVPGKLTSTCLFNKTNVVETSVK